MQCDINGYEDLYEINTLGQVFSKEKWVARRGRNNRIHLIFRERKELTWKKRGEYPGVALYNQEGKKKNFNIHRLVAEHFLPNPYNLPEVNHKDEDKWNPLVENLEWCSKSYNQEYSKAKEYKFINPEGDEVTIVNLTKYCRENNLSQGMLVRVHGGFRKSHKGWRKSFSA